MLFPQATLDIAADGFALLAQGILPSVAMLSPITVPEDNPLAYGVAQIASKYVIDSQCTTEEEISRGLEMSSFPNINESVAKDVLDGVARTLPSGNVTYVQGSRVVVAPLVIVCASITRMLPDNSDGDDAREAIRRSAIVLL